MIIRILEKTLKEYLAQQKPDIAIVYGARQVGKTTLLKKIQREYAGTSLFLNCDEPDVRAALTDKTSTELKRFLGNADLIIIDEAQRVPNIGLTLKLITDTYPEFRIIASGSSSFDLAQTIKEPLTGRKTEFTLFPISYAELASTEGELAARRLLDSCLTYGMYPRAITGGVEEARTVVDQITESYLYKDLFALGAIRKPEVLEKLVQALALQIGKEVSYTELATLIGVQKETIDRYVQVLESAFIVFRLSPFSRNLRKEIAKSRKIYFWDVGVRNSVIRNFNALDIRTDVGMLWENFIIAERLKYNQYRAQRANTFFWRTYSQQEIDYIEDRDGTLNAYEFKFGNKDPKAPPLFTASYPDASFEVVNKENYEAFVGVANKK